MGQKSLPCDLYHYRTENYVVMSAAHESGQTTCLYLVAVDSFTSIDTNLKHTSRAHNFTQVFPICNIYTVQLDTQCGCTD